MPAKFSTGLRNGMLTTDSFKGLMDGAYLKLYAGTIPGSADDAIGSATLLNNVTNNSTATGVTFSATASAGVMSKTAAETWSGANVATGTATFFRLQLPSDAGLSSSTELRVQGTIGIGADDLNVSSVALVTGAPQLVNYFVVAIPTA